MEQNPPKDQDGQAIADSWLYKTFVKTAYRLLSKPLSLLELLKKTLSHLQQYDSLRTLAEEAKTQILSFYRLIKAYAKGEYRAIPPGKIVLMVAALLYFVSPFDLIPDFLGIGLLDDIALVSWVFKSLYEEILAFLDWEDSQKERIELNNNG